MQNLKFLQQDLKHISWVIISRSKITSNTNILTKEAYWFINSFSPIGFERYIFRDKNGYFLNTRRGIPLFDASFSHKPNLVFLENITKKDFLFLKLLVNYIKENSTVRFVLIGNLFLKELFENPIVRRRVDSNFKKIKEIKWN